MPTTSRVELYIDPSTYHFLQDRLFEPSTAALGGDNILGPYIELRDYFEARGVPVHTADLMPDPEPGVRRIFMSFGRLGSYRRVARRPDVTLSAFVAMECPIVEPKLFRALPDAARHFRRVLSWSDTAALLPFTGEPVPVQRFAWPQAYDDVVDGAWSRERTRFLAMINANKLPRLYDRELYTERLRAVAYFHRFGEIDLYGKNWKRMPNRVGRTWVPGRAKLLYRVFWEARQRRWPDPLYQAAAEADRGPVLSKIDTLANYTFALCFENMILKGWITEKIFDCFFAGTIPVYWGEPEIERHVPPEAFIDMRRFADYGELRDYLHALGPDQIAAYREAGRAFVRSPAFEPFRSRAFARMLWSITAEDAGIPAEPVTEPVA